MFAKLPHRPLEPTLDLSQHRCASQARHCVRERRRPNAMAGSVDALVRECDTQAVNRSAADLPRKFDKTQST